MWLLGGGPEESVTPLGSIEKRLNAGISLANYPDPAQLVPAHVFIDVNETFGTTADIIISLFGQNT